MILRTIFFLLYLVSKSKTLLCFNGTFTHSNYGEDPLVYRGLFVPSPRNFARSRCVHTVYCQDNAMCFVRSWRARTRYAWIVQRGCYQPINDSLLKYMNKPTRAMTCTDRKLREAEYQVCLCRADWCNVAPNYPHHYLPVAALIFTIVVYCIF